MKDIAAAYEKEAGDKVRFTFGSSGQLMAQVRNGAPIDAFVSAADKQVDALIETGHLDKATRCVVAGNALVLVVPADAKDGAPASFDDLKDPKHRRVAIGEPKTVPAGQYAMQVLEKHGVARPLREGRRLVYGANVRQVLDYVLRGEVSAGLVYATDARQAGEDGVRVVATADAASHDAIVYPAGVVTASRKREAAARFLEFLQGEKARAILKEHGFSIPGEDAEPGEDEPADAEQDDDDDDADNPADDRAEDPKSPPADKPARHEPAGR